MSGAVSRTTSSRVRPEVAVQGMFLLLGVVIASFFPFFALFLSERGLSAGRIGTVIAAMAVARIVANPVWGHLADTSIGRRTAFQIGAAGAAASAIVLFLVEDYPAILATGFVFAVFSTTAGPNADAIVLEHLGESRMSEYGRIRGWESLSYAVSCLLIGLTLETTTPTWEMPIYAVASLTMFVWAFTLRRDRPGPIESHGRLGAVGAAFRAAPKLWQFLLALLLVWTGFNAAWNFIALKIEQGGGGPLLVGLGTALGGIVEVPVMRMSSRLGRAWGLRRVIVLGCSVYSINFLLWGLIEDPTIVSALTVLEGVGFALLFTSAVVVIGKMLPSSLYSTGQSVSLVATFGVAPILGAGIGGVVFERLGSTTSYVGASALALAGGCLMWVALSDPAVAQPEPPVEAVL